MATKPNNDKQNQGGQNSASFKGQQKVQISQLPNQSAASPDKLRTVQLQKPSAFQLNSPAEGISQPYLNGYAVRKDVDLQVSNGTQPRNSGNNLTQDSQAINAPPQRILINPQNYIQQQKEFMIDKQEYQYVFRMIDKDNLGKISIQQVNAYLEKFDSLHKQRQLKKQNETSQNNNKSHNQSNKNTAQNGYQRVRIQNGVNQGKTQKQTQQNQFIGQHLLSQGDHPTATGINNQNGKSQDRTVGIARRNNQVQQQADNKTPNKNSGGQNTQLSQPQQNQIQVTAALGNQTQKSVSSTPIVIQNKNITASAQKPYVQNNSYGQAQLVAGGSKVQTERMQKGNEIQGPASNLTTATSSINKVQQQQNSGLQTTKIQFKQSTTSDSPMKRQSQSGVGDQQQNKNDGTGLNLQLKLVQINSPGRANNSRASSATDQGSSNQLQNDTQQTIDQSQVSKFPNGKPTLEFEEFIEIIRDSCTDPEGAENFLVHAFSMFDVDRKGYINKEDLKLVFELLEENVTDDELTTMIKIASLKSGDRINFKEFVDFFYLAD